MVSSCQARQFIVAMLFDSLFAQCWILDRKRREIWKPPIVGGDAIRLNQMAVPAWACPQEPSLGRMMEGSLVVHGGFHS
jgi:hypothetical protein